MAAVLRKVTLKLPVKALEEAMRATGKGITETIVEGLREVARQHRSSLRALKGKVRFELDLQGTRR